MGRRLLAVVATAAVLIGVGATAAQAAAFGVTLKASTTTVLVGKTFTVSGAVSPPATGKPVYLQRYTSGAWRDVATLTLTSSSTFSMTRTAPSSATTFTYRVRKPASGSTAAGVSPTVRVSVVSSAYTVKLTAPAEATSSSFDVTGSVSPAAAGATVTLQRLSGSTWKAVSTATLSSTSTYRFTRSESVLGTYSYRVVKSSSSTVAAGSSPSAKVAVTSTLLRQGKQLNPGAYLQSANGQYRLTMQADGNLVHTVAASGRVLWASGTGGKTGAVAVMQGDGNLVVYLGSTAVWSSRTGGHADSGAWATGIQDDANVVVYDGSKPYWSNGARNTQIAPREVLKPGWFIRSPDSHYQLTMQGDGNLVQTVAGTNRPLWSSSTGGKAGAYLLQQTDGNAVIYLGSTALWATSTGGGGGVLALQTDANVVQYVAGAAKWASSTVNDRLMPGERLDPGWFLNSHGGGYQLVQQGDGNLVQYLAGKATWASGTGGLSGAYTVMQHDGNLVVYTGGTARWATGTGGKNGAFAVNQSDGNIVLYQGGTAVWASKGAGSGSTPERVPFTGSRTITATWGSPSGGYHAASSPAIDVAMPIGTPVYAAGGGKVIEVVLDRRHCDPRKYSNYVQGCIDAGYGGSGVRVRVEHPDGRRSLYLHLDGVQSGVAVGATVSAGQQIATSGNTGISEGPHLHYAEFNSSGTAIDPGNWVACHGSSRVVYDGMQYRKGQTIRNDGYGC